MQVCLAMRISSETPFEELQELLLLILEAAETSDGLLRLLAGNLETLPGFFAHVLTDRTALCSRQADVAVIVLDNALHTLDRHVAVCRTLGRGH
jgi:hypothetical protein